MPTYIFDGTMTGLLCCVFRAFQLKEFDVQVTANLHPQTALFGECVEIFSNDVQAQRVWQGLQQKVAEKAIRHFYYTFLAEQDQAFQHLFNFSVYVFLSPQRIDYDYRHVDVLALAQYAKQVSREKHRMQAFVRFKKSKDGIFLSLIRPDFNVLPLIERHFTARYQDQEWLIYDEKRNYGIYYNLHSVHQVHMNAQQLDRHLATGLSQSFKIELDDEEFLYDQLWKDYFNSVNIEARKNIKLHVQYVPKRYWRYMNEKII